MFRPCLFMQAGYCTWFYYWLIFPSNLLVQIWFCEIHIFLLYVNPELAFPCHLLSFHIEYCMIFYFYLSFDRSNSSLGISVLLPPLLVRICRYIISNSGISYGIFSSFFFMIKIGLFFVLMEFCIHSLVANHKVLHIFLNEIMTYVSN